MLKIFDLSLKTQHVKMVFILQLSQIGAKFMFVAGMFVSGCVTILFG